MTSLDWLAVSGVRSFDHNTEPQIIKFFKPLTIILGANGAGKVRGEENNLLSDDFYN
jgi:hypothetical protein